MKNIAIFASGSGSNFENLINNKELNKYANIEFLICDKKEAYVLERAKKINIKSYLVDFTKFNNKKDFENKILELVKNIDFIVLAGYMRIISSYFIENFRGKIINIHPSLLPKYKGINSIKRAYNDKEEYIGVSIHYVNEEIDAGKILAQDKFKVDYSKNLDEITQQVHELEHKLYPKTLVKLFEGE